MSNIFTIFVQKINCNYFFSLIGQLSKNPVRKSALTNHYRNKLRVTYVYVLHIVNFFVSFQSEQSLNIKMPSKTSLRDKLDDEVLDLSLMQLNEVPVSEIVSILRRLFIYLAQNNLFI